MATSCSDKTRADGGELMDDKDSIRSTKTNPDDSLKVLDPKEVWVEVLKNFKLDRPQEEEFVKKRRRSDWHNIRIFVSSTFTDFKYEREVLIKQVFQDLRLWCQKRRLRLIDVDLRWGVPLKPNKEQTGATSKKKDDETLEICMQGINKCKEENVMPYFINLTSCRRGWIPHPNNISVDLMKKYNLVYGLSVTEMEIVTGGFEKTNPNAIFLLRDDSFLREIKPEIQKQYFIAKTDKQQEEDEKGLQELRKKINELFVVNRNPAEREQVFTYKCHYKGMKSFPIFTFEPEDIFSKTVLEFFKKRIAIQYPDDDFLPEDDFLKATLDQECFMKMKSARVRGRDDIMKKIIDYTKTSGYCSPLVIVGEAGSGKSSLMALAVKRMSNLNRTLFYHFVGAVPNSTDLLQMLCRLLLELEVVTETTLPSDLQTACPLVYGILQNEDTHPIIIVVDAINQFDETSESSTVRWLPAKLAPQIRCIVSVLSGSIQFENLAKWQPKPSELRVDPLTRDVCKVIIDETLAEYNKCLSEEEMGLFLEKKGIANPFWLSLAIEELRVHGEFRKKIGKNEFEYLIQKKIKHFPDELNELLHQVLRRLQDEAGEEIGHLLESTLCLLEVSRSGLLEDELLELLQRETADNEQAGDPEVVALRRRIPARKWALIERALHVFLRPFGNLGEGRLDFYHRSISKVVREKFLQQKVGRNTAQNPNKKVVGYHKKLAKYFWESSIYCRKVEELPYHLIILKDTKKLREFLCNWETLEELYDSELSSKLFSYWRQSGDTDLKKMVSSYCNQLQDMKEKMAKLVYGEKLAKLASLVLQAGHLSTALSLAQESISLAREMDIIDRLIDSYGVAARTNLQLARKFKVTCPEELPYLYSCAEYCRMAIDLFSRITVDPDRRDIKVKLAKLKHVLAYALIMIDQIKGEWAETYNGKLPKEECLEVIKDARQVFEQLADHGSVADAMRIEAMAYWRKAEKDKQFGLFDEALSRCKRIYGRYHWLTAGIHHNIGVAHQYHENYRDAYDNYKQSFLINYVICGPNHSETIKEMKVMRKSEFKSFHCDAKVTQEAQKQM